MAFSFKQGKYTGNGSTTQAITGVGFQPKVVFIFADNYTGWQSAIYKTDTMATGNTTGANANWGENGLEASGKISSLDADGFTVAGTDSTTRNAINKSATTYYYVAIGGTDVVTGSFSGNGSDNRGITGVGFQAELVVVQCGNNHVRFKTKASGVSTDLSSFSSGPSLGAAANGIQSIDSDGFTVGSDNSVNQSGQTVHWFAVKTVTGVKSGQFTGNANDNRSITGAGFQPQFVMIKQESGGATRPDDEAAIQTAQHYTDAGDSTMASRNDNSYANGIQQFLSDGFEVGTHNAVNKNSATINWFAFGPSTTTYNQAVTATAAVTGALTKGLSKTLTVTPAVTGSVLKQMAKSLTATATVTANMVKQMAKSLIANVAVTASMVATKVYLETLEATVAVTSALTKIPGKLLTGTASVTASLTKVSTLTRTLQATATVTGAVLKGLTKTLEATSAVSGVLTKVPGKLLQATAAITATIGKTHAKVLTATAAVTASLVAGRAVIMNATVATTATVEKTVGKLLAVTLSITAKVLAPFWRTKYPAHGDEDDYQIKYPHD